MLGTKVDDVGYISPGHGLKGHQNTCLIDEDLDQMYDEFKRKDILLWCYAITEKNKVEGISDKPRKRSRTCEDSGEKPSSKCDVYERYLKLRKLLTNLEKAWQYP